MKPISCKSNGFPLSSSRKIRQMIETKLSLFSLQEELETQQATVTSENSELFFEAGNCSGHIFEETVPEEYMILSDPLNTSDHESTIRTLCSHIGYCNKNNLNASQEEYLTKISCRFFRKAEMSPVSILLFSIETGGTYSLTYSTL